MDLINLELVPVGDLCAYQVRLLLQALLARDRTARTFAEKIAAFAH